MSNTAKVVFVWNEITGYMSACWKALQDRSAVSLKVISYPSARPYDATLISSLNDCKIVNPRDYSELQKEILGCAPEVLVLCGWGNPEVRKLAVDPRFDQTKKVVAFDSPWKGTVRQRVGLLLLRRRMKRISAAVIASERGRTYAHRLGFTDAQIATGMYSIDYDAFSEAVKMRATPWPRQFVFVGRYVSEKGIHCMIDAYRNYRSSVVDPWPLLCLGSGPLKSLLAECPGIIDGGFVQPYCLPKLLAESGVFVLPSVYEPWGAVIAEASAAGLPILCSTACGAAIDLVHHCFNGYTFAANDQTQLKNGFIWTHRHYDLLPTFGQRSHELAKAYTAEAWADRWEDLIQRLQKD